MLWDIESGSLHVVDYLAFLVCKKHFNLSFTDKDESELNLFDDEQKQLALNELLSLEKQALLNSGCKITSYNRSISFIKSLCLNICHDCNFRCDYCFAKDGTYNTEKDYMSEEVGFAAVDFLIKNSGTIYNLEIDFFGGEPLLNFDVVKNIVNYAREKEKKAKKLFHFTLTTNCVGLNDERIDFLNQEMDNVVLSIDGRCKTHDKVRKDKTGKGTYRLAINKAKKFKQLRGNKNYYIRGTFTSLNLDFSSDILHMVNEGFDQVSIEPVVLPSNHPLAIKENLIDDILKEYEAFAQKYIEYRNTSKWFNFFHFMIDLDNGPCTNKRLNGCGAGVEYLAVSPTGDIFPCHQFVGINDFKIGNIFNDSLNNNIRIAFSENNLLTKTHCKNCFAKYFCGGGCAANGYHETGSIDGMYEIGCILTRKRLELSLGIWAIEKLKGK